MIYQEELTPDQRRARIAALKEKLKAVVEAGRKATAEYARLLAKFKRLEASATATATDAANQEKRVNEHHKKRPDDIFATADEMAQWEAKLLTLNRELERLRAVRDNADTNRVQYRPLVLQAARDVEYLQRGAVNIRNEMEATIQVRRR